MPYNIDVGAFMGKCRKLLFSGSWEVAAPDGWRIQGSGGGKPESDLIKTAYVKVIDPNGNLFDQVCWLYGMRNRACNQKPNWDPSKVTGNLTFSTSAMGECFYDPAYQDNCHCYDTGHGPTGWLEVIIQRMIIHSPYEPPRPPPPPNGGGNGGQPSECPKGLFNWQGPLLCWLKKILKI